ncbi:hypothetical protein BJV82DRAFT_67930 [Fennellomyces sp. T-0311]|nr:hypothetical protein BJV82DRAFT_67930 [Fennellomyces sp. T-0311]
MNNRWPILPRNDSRFPGPAAARMTQDKQAGCFLCWQRQQRGSRSLLSVSDPMTSTLMDHGSPLRLVYELRSPSCSGNPSIAGYFCIFFFFLINSFSFSLSLFFFSLCLSNKNMSSEDIPVNVSEQPQDEPVVDVSENATTDAPEQVDISHKDDDHVSVDPAVQAAITTAVNSGSIDSSAILAKLEQDKLDAKPAEEEHKSEEPAVAEQKEEPVAEVSDNAAVEEQKPEFEIPVFEKSEAVDAAITAAVGSAAIDIYAVVDAVVKAKVEAEQEAKRLAEEEAARKAAEEEEAARKAAEEEEAARKAAEEEAARKAAEEEAARKAAEEEAARKAAEEEAARKAAEEEAIRKAAEEEAARKAAEEEPHVKPRRKRLHERLLRKKLLARPLKKKLLARLLKKKPLVRLLRKRLFARLLKRKPLVRQQNKKPFVRPLRRKLLARQQNKRPLRGQQKKLRGRLLNNKHLNVLSLLCLFHWLLVKSTLTLLQWKSHLHKRNCQPHLTVKSSNNHLSKSPRASARSCKSKLFQKKLYS